MRLTEDICVACGNPLLDEHNEYRVCVFCKPKILKAIYETKMRGRDKSSKTQKTIGPRRKLYLSREPIGEKME